MGSHARVAECLLASLVPVCGAQQAADKGAFQV